MKGFSWTRAVRFHIQSASWRYTIKMPLIYMEFQAIKIFNVARRQIYKHLKAFIIVCVIFIVTLHIPKSSWLCCSDPNQILQTYSNDHQAGISFDELYRKLNVKGPSARPANKHHPEQLTNVLRMFPIYSENREHTSNKTTAAPKRLRARVNLFELKNYDFKNFNRFWENKASGLEHDFVVNHQEMQPKKRRYDPGSILDSLAASHTSPECITLRFRRPLQPRTKVCVHSRREDNVISNQLRDFGHWEPDLLDQMQTFFEHSPSSQLVDLGCNTGIYTLLAARLGRPVLAVDALPANLALLQLAVFTNDRAALDTEGGDDVEQLLQSIVDTREGGARMARRHNSKFIQAMAAPTRPTLFSELITTLHNAVYSRRVRMFVDITDEPNLGGMEVKELPGSEATKPPQSRNVLSDATGKLPGLTQTEDASHRMLVDAVCLDDLVPYVKPNMSIYLKMDIEGAEAHVLRCANHFFSTLDVRVVQMEILLQRYSGHMGEITDFFQRHNLWPSEDVSGHKMLGSEPTLWPDNMFWIKVR